MVAVSEPDEAQGYFGCHRRSKQQQILAGYYCIPKAAFLSNANNVQVSNESS